MYDPVKAARRAMFTGMSSDAVGFSNMSAPPHKENEAAFVATIAYQPVLERIRHVPGVIDAAMITAPPFSRAGVQSNFEIIGKPTDSRGQVALISGVSGDYAYTMGTPLLRGRMVDDGDVGSTPFVAVINEALANKYFADGHPVGKRIDLGSIDARMTEPYRILGVFADQIEGKVGGEVLQLILLPQQQIPTTSLFYRALLKKTVSFM